MTNKSNAPNLMRSAMAPMMSAGVMMANMSWYIEKVLCGTLAAYVVFGAVPTPFTERHVEAADERATRCERDAVAERPPQHSDEPCDAHALGHDRQHVLAPDETAVEEREARQCHEKYERRAHHHEAVVAGAGRHDLRGLSSARAPLFT